LPAESAASAATSQPLIVHQSTGGLFMPEQVPLLLDDLRRLGLKV